MNKHLSEMTLAELTRPEGIPCSCGRVHRCGLRWFKAGKGALRELPRALEAIGVKKPFVVMDKNTRTAAGEQVLRILTDEGIPHVSYVFPREPEEGKMEPDEYAVGALTMAFDPSCDGLLAVGSGVINDCCKVVAHATGRPSAVVCTAPSMDGYCSNSSSMIRDRVKVSLYNACPQAILADTEVLKTAPDIMLQAGLGDMLAKYVALCEWRISHIVHNDPYCEEIAGLVRASLARIVEQADGLMAREEEALKAVVEGLVLSGMAMAFAEISRPASGLEHYFSHLWEMQALQRGVPSALHGIQVGVGTQLTLWIYEHVLNIDEPDPQKARDAMAGFSREKWEATMKEIFGAIAPQILALEEELKKNTPENHEKRLQLIVAHWPEIRRAMIEELPARETVVQLMTRCGLPLTPADLGISRNDTVAALKGSREIRDKYLTSSLLWDMGLTEEYAAFFQREGEGEHGQCRVDAVALTPERTVEDDRGQKQHCEEAGDLPPGPVAQTGAQPQAAPGQKHVESDAEKLDEIQLADRQIGEKGEEIEVGDIVVAHGLTQRAEAAMAAVKIHPGSEEVLIVERLVIEGQQAQREGQRCQQAGDDPLRARAQHARAIQEEQRQRRLQEQ